jgi:hypothetical protein
MKRLLVFATALAVSAAAAATVFAQPPLPYAPVPPPRYEAIPPPPGARYVWVPGHWHWNGYRYVWIAGRYEIRQPHWAHYVPGRWVWSAPANQWVWRPAHWQ